MRLKSSLVKHFLLYVLAVLIVLFGHTQVESALAQRIEQVSMPCIGQVESIIEFNGNLYIGVRDNVVDCTVPKLWMSPDGINFTDITGNMTIGNPRNLVIYQNGLYLFGNTSSSHGAAVWRKDNTASSMDLIVDNAFYAFKNPQPLDYKKNLDIPGHAIFNDRLYVGTRNQEQETTGTGGEVWMSDEGTTWSQSGENGLGNADNSRILSLVVFNGQLYAAARNDIEGLQVYRTSNGETWEKVVGSGTDTEAGFGCPTNRSPIDTVVFNGYLYMGILMRGPDEPQQCTPPGDQQPLIWRSSDGVNWSPVIDNLSDNINNIGIGSFAVYDNKFYVGTHNKNEGAELWSSTDGVTWNRLSAGGFGNPADNIVIRSMQEYNNALYIGTGSFYGSSPKGEVWKMTGTDEWTGLGPDTGFFHSMALSPTYGSDHTLFAAGWSGGFYKSTDGGVTWKQNGLKDLVGGGTPAVAISPDYSIDKTVFTAARETFYTSSDAGITWSSSGFPIFGIRTIAPSPDYAVDKTVFAGSYDGGIYKSINGGSNWIRIFDSTSIWSIVVSPIFSTDLTVFASQYGMQIALSPNYGIDRTVFAPHSPLYKSIDGGITWNNLGQVGGVSTDGGSTWQNPPFTARSFAVTPNFVSNGTVFAGTNEGRIYKSEDRGISWTEVYMTGMDVRSIVISENYATDKTVFAATFGNGIFKSTDGGMTWNNLAISNTAIRSLVVSPNFMNDSTLFAGTSFSGVYKSTNKGLTWSQADAGFENTGTLNISSIALSPNFSLDNTVFMGRSSYGGIYKSTDGGNFWVPSGFNALFGSPEATGITEIAVSPSYPADPTIFAGTSVNGLQRSTDGGMTWNSVFPGVSSSNVVISPNFVSDGTVFSTAGLQHQPGLLYKSTSRGDTWTQLPITQAGTIEISPNYVSDHTIIVGSRNGLYKSTDGGSIWTKIFVYTDITAVQVAFSPNYAFDNTMFASNWAKGLYRSTDRGAIWALIGWLPTPYIKSIAVSPDYASDKTVYVGTDGGGIYSYVLSDASQQFDTQVTTGNNVPVEPAPGISMTFNNVAADGSVTVVETAAVSPPSNFSLLANVYEITTTATVSGQITICLSYDDTGLSEAEENTIQLLHKKAGVWEDVTTSRDIGNNIICGVTDSLSPFAIVLHQSDTTPGSTSVPTAGGAMFVTTSGQADILCSNSTCNGSMNNGYKLNDASSPSAANGGALYINWGDGTPIARHDPGGSYTHTYNHIGKYRVTQTVKDTNGNRSGQRWTMNVSGGATGKGTLEISASGSTYFNIGYKVMDGNTTVTTGTIGVGESKGITLDAKTYSVKFTYQSKTPLTDPLTYHSCLTLPAGATTSSNGSTVIVSGVTVPVGGTVTVSLTDCIN